MNFAAVGNAANQVLGNIEKAVIEIIDTRSRQLIVQPPVSAAGSSVSGSVSIPGTGAGAGAAPLPSLQAAATLTGEKGLMDVANSLAGGAAGNVQGGLNALEGATQKLFYVQFNPSELSLSGYGGGLVQKTNYIDSKGEITFEAADVRIMLNVKLIFDRTDPQDAFMADKLNTAPTALATGVAKGVMTALGKKDYSVQTEVEGFIAALRSPNTRRITFHWGNMNYTGVLNNVSSQYTMFNVQGIPIRATVELSMVCADKKVSPNSMGGWQTHYDKAFGQGSQSLVGVAQKAGNLLNFNL